MKHSRFVLLAAVGLFLLTGCATDPVSTHQPREDELSSVGSVLLIGVPTALSRSQPTGEQFSLSEVPEGKAIVYVFREGHLVNSGILPVSIDGKTITLLQGGGYAQAMVEPGVHEIAFPEMLLPMLHRNGDPYNMPPARLTIMAQPNEAIFLEFGFYKPYERGQTGDSEGMEHLPVVKLSSDATYVTVTSLSEEEAVTKFARNRGSPMPSAQRPIKNYP